MNGLLTNKKFFKALLIIILILGLLFMWFFLTIGIIKGYPIANEEGEIVGMMPPHSLRDSEEFSLIDTYKSNHRIDNEGKIYRAWKKNWLKIGMWTHYINDSDWTLNYQ